ncbi:glycohydrolase toxin TNT-related protein [uncultured Mycobacterium sp.]|uniref:TNT domain-containing protein n=1 Tax=uncultured Mycobacterium sp. TaxID=171292 RepID=UPI0035CC300B
MQLQNIDLGKLIAAAGGDPWQVNASLQSGRPAQIAELGQAFHNAGQCTAEADNAFVEAYRRFEASWNRDNGEHPINDSAEVQRTIRSLRGQATQLPKIAVDLESIAATLAEAQRTCAVLISTLEAQLTDIDKQIGAAEELEKTGHLSAADKEAVDQLIASLEHTAIDDTKSTLAQLQSIRAGYSDYLQKSLTNLRSDGYDPDGIHGVDAEQPKDHVPGAIPPSGLEAGHLADIKRVTNQAVLDQMAKVRAAQKGIDDALATAYTKGPGSPEGQAALASLPQLKKNLADALNNLGNLPDYNNIDPSTLRTSPDGHFLFGYTADGQPVQVTGQLKNGTGEIIDQGTQTYYTFKDGKLIATRTLDPGRAEATDEPLLSAVTLAVGAPELKAGGEAAWQGLKTLFTRETLASGTDITSDNVLPRALAAAETRAQAAAQSLATDHPLPLPHTATSDHPVPLTTGEHPTPTTHESALAAGGPHSAPGGEVPHPLPSDSPLFNGYHPIEPGPEFTRADGSLIYPDDSLPSKPYAIPGTVVPDTHLPAGTELGRFGHPGGAYLAPEGTPFAQLSLPPESAMKPYYRYVVEDPAKLPPGWNIEQSQAAPWFHQPGGGIQYRIIAPPDQKANVQTLIDWGYLRVVKD